MSFNYNKLKGRIVECFGTRTAFAAAIGITNETLSRKLNGRSHFSNDEITKMCDLLKIDYNRIPVYFFATSDQSN